MVCLIDMKNKKNDKSSNENLDLEFLGIKFKFISNNSWKSDSGIEYHVIKPAVKNSILSNDLKHNFYFEFATLDDSIDFSSNGHSSSIEEALKLCLEEINFNLKKIQNDIDEKQEILNSLQSRFPLKKNE